jgi:sugar-specific transcriptional regulator TrmB
MSKLTTTLISFGLSSSEAAVYECGLKEGVQTVAEISRLLGMNRVTVYHALHQLEQKGLLQKRTENGKLTVSVLREEGMNAYFAFEEAKLQNKKEEIAEMFARLPKTGKKSSKPEIEYFSGFEGITLALEIAFRTPSRHWDILAPKNNFFSQVDEEYAQYYLAERKKRNMTNRTLWENTWDVGHFTEKILQERNPRYIPEKYNGTFQSVMILFVRRKKCKRY